MTLSASSILLSTLQSRDATTSSIMMCAMLFAKWYRSTMPGWFAANSLHWPAANTTNTYSPRQLVQVIFKLWKDVFNVDQTCSYSGLSSTVYAKFGTCKQLSFIWKQDMSYHLMLDSFTGSIISRSFSHQDECSLWKFSAINILNEWLLMRLFRPTNICMPSVQQNFLQRGVGISFPSNCD